MIEVAIPVIDMKDEDCEKRIEEALGRQPGVQAVKADHKTKRIDLAVDETVFSIAHAQAVILTLGYMVDTH